MGLKSDHWGVSTAGREPRKRAESTGANSVDWPAARTRIQEMVTRTPDMSGGHLQPNDVLSGRGQLAGLRQVLASSTNG